MFLEDDKHSFDIISVLRLEWDERNAKAINRPFHALSFRISGEAEFIYPGGSTDANAKDILFVPEYFDYTLRSKKEDLIAVHLTSTDDLPKKITKFKTENPQYFERKFKELHSAWIKQQPGYRYECKSIFYKILTAIEREIASTDRAVDNRISDAIEYIHENFMVGEMSIATLTNMCGMSDTYFRRLFVERTSMTPIKYINSLKLNYALELLKSGYYNIQEISDKCGFSTVNYFSLFIKKETGFSPLALCKRF